MGNANGPFSDQYGFRVVEIKEGSPAHKSGLQVSTDYIICFNGRNLNEMETHEITRAVAENENKILYLDVYSSRDDSHREVQLIPSRNWPGEGLLGVIIRYDRFDADKKSSEQNMAFDQLYEGGDTNAVPNFKNTPTAPPRKSVGGSDSPATLAKTESRSSSFFTKKTPTGKVTTENPARSGGNIDLDSEFSFDNIYDGNEFTEANPVAKKKTTTPAKSSAGQGSGTPGNGSPATVPKETTPSQVKSPESEQPAKKRQSLTQTLSSSVFSWSSKDK